jgi:hypothetical protein
VAFLVAARAVAQPVRVHGLHSELPDEQVARNEVAAERRIEARAELAMAVLHAGVEHGDRDRPVAGGRRPGGGHVHAVVVPLEDPLGVGDAEERAEPVQRVRDGAAVGGPEIAADRRVLEGRRDGAVGVETLSEPGRPGDHRERVDRAQIGDDDPAGRRDRRAHLRGTRAGREADHADAERVGRRGRSRKRKRGAECRNEEAGPLHRLVCRSCGPSARSPVLDHSFGNEKGRLAAALLASIRLRI